MLKATTLAALVVALPLVAQAQSGIRAADRMADLSYCQALSEKYIRYVGNSQHQQYNRRPEVEGRVALAKCEEGNSAAAIPVLERKLIGGKVPLPARNAQDRTSLERN